jgi:hypothetical protein
MQLISVTKYIRFYLIVDILDVHKRSFGQLQLKKWIVPRYFIFLLYVLNFSC